jgi:hypothetical protein
VKILINKKELIKSFTYAIDECESDKYDLTVEDAINFIVKIESVVKNLPKNLTLGTIGKVMEEVLSENIS